jgi:RNAse (barnase) inhibitor barstar
MKEFIIDGNKFKNSKSFHKYAEKILTNGLSWETGRNLDAFSELLEGGFGQHGFGEKIIIKWINMAKSKENLSIEFYDSLIKIISEAENVIFERIDYRE